MDKPNIPQKDSMCRAIHEELLANEEANLYSCYSAYESYLEIGYSEEESRSMSGLSTQQINYFKQKENKTTSKFRDMTTLPDLGLFIYSNNPENAENQIFRLDHILFNSLTRIAENQFSIFASYHLENGVEYALSIDLDYSQVDLFLQQLAPALPNVSKGIAAEFDQPFEEPIPISLENLEVYMRLDLSLKLKDGVLKDGNGEEFVPFKPHLMEVVKVCEKLWSL